MRGGIKSGTDISVPGTLGLKTEENGEVVFTEKVPAVCSKVMTN